MGGLNTTGHGAVGKTLEQVQRSQTFFLRELAR